MSSEIGKHIKETVLLNTLTNCV